MRIQGQKKNFWGNWKYKEGYTTNGNISWDFSIGIDGSPSTSPFPNFTAGGLPASEGWIPPSYVSPYNWQYPSASFNYGVNNAFINLYPGKSGYYSYTNPVSSITDGFRLSDVNGTCVINGITLNLSYVVINN